MPTKSVEVDVDIDLDDFKNKELIDEIIYRWDELKSDQKERLKKIADDKPDVIDTIERQMKYDFFLENIDNITQYELESLV